MLYENHYGERQSREQLVNSRMWKKFVFKELYARMNTFI